MQSLNCAWTSTQADDEQAKRNAPAPLTNACSGSPALVPVMEAANLRDRNDPSGLRCLDSAWFRAVLLQCQMGPGPMIITAECLQMVVQAAFIEDNDVIQAFATNGADEPFDIRALPWRSRCRQHLVDSHCLHLLDEVVSEDPIPVAEQISAMSSVRRAE
jgi:hypothetical protein